MKIRSAYSLALLATAFALAVAGCGGGGGSKSLPAVQQGQLGSKVGVTFTFRIGGSSTLNSSQRSPKYLPTTTQSIVIEYIGDNSSATPAPANSPPSTAAVATTVNVAVSATNPPPAGQCYNNAGSYICTITVQLPVGVLDLYILAYDGQNGTGNLIGANVTVVQVAQSGALTNAGTSTPVSIVLGANPTTIAFNVVSSIVPVGTPNPAVTPASFPSNAPPFVYSQAATMNVGGIPPNTTMSSITITDNDTSGQTCLVYIASGATSATPCPMSSAKSSVTLSNSSDAFAVLYSGKFLSNGAISLSATGVSSPLPVDITPTIFPAAAPINFSSSFTGPNGTLVYDSTGSTVYVGMANSGTPLYSVAYSTSTGYGAATAVAVTSVNGSAASSLAGSGVNAITIGPDNNLWIAEYGGRDTTQYVAVAAIHSPVINPLNGTTIQPGAGVFAEYTLSQAAPGPNGNASPQLKAIATSGGYIWVMDHSADIWRINPTSGVVNPNLGSAYSPGQSVTGANTSYPLTDTTGATSIAGNGSVVNTPAFPVGTSIYFTDAAARSFDAATLDTSTAPSAGLCTPAGPPPCIAAFQRFFTGSVNAARERPNGAATDGANFYVIDTSTGNVHKITPPSTLVTSTGAFSSIDGGLVVTPDGWFWSLSGGGVQALPGMTATGAVSPTAVSACSSSNDHARGSFPLIVGPDGTLLFSPDIEDSSGTVAVLCSVVY